MVDGLVFAALVVGVFEEPGVQVAGCVHGEGVEDPLLLWFCHDGQIFEVKRLVCTLDEVLHDIYMFDNLVKE